MHEAAHSRPVALDPVERQEAQRRLREAERGEQSHERREGYRVAVCAVALPVPPSARKTCNTKTSAAPTMLRQKADLRKGELRALSSSF